MTDLTDAPRLPDAYSDYRGKSEDEAAYAQMLSRIQGGPPPGAAVAATAAARAEPPPATLQPTRLTEPPAGAAAAAKSTAPTEEMIQAEMARLSSEPADKKLYANPAAARAQALKNLGATDEDAAPKGPTGQEVIDEAGRGGGALRLAAGAYALAGVASRAGRDLGVGAFETPGAIARGVRDALQSSINGAADLGTWLEKEGGFPGLRINLKGLPNYDPSKPALSIASGEELQHLYRPLEGRELPGRFEQTTLTAGMVKGVVQFGTSMVLAGREMKLLGIPTQAAGWAGRGLTAAKGFLAMFEGFDGAQHRLSDLVQQVPSLRNPVTAFIATKPDDNEAVSRLKNAVEGSVIGQAADGVVAGLRALRGAYATREAAQSAVERAAQAPPPPPSAGLDALGVGAAANEEAPKSVVEIGRDWGLPEPASAKETKLVEGARATEGMTPEDVASAHAAPHPEEPGEIGAHEMRINFGRIETGDDVKKAMQDLADRFADNIDVARRGVRTFQQTQLGAQAEDAFKVLMERRQGEPLNAEQGLAARQLWASSARKTMELADIALQAPTVENLFAFRRMLATHAAIQQEVIAARTETARALGAWRIPAGDDPLRLEQMVNSLSADAGLKGGAQTALTLASKVRDLAIAQDYETFDRFLEKSTYARGRDAVLEAYTNGLLTGPLTHVKVIASNSATVALRIAERAVASKLDELMGNTDGVAAGEAAAQVAGLVGGSRDALRFAGKLARSAWNTGTVDLASETWEEGAQHGMPPLEDDPLSKAILAARTGQYSLKPMGDPEYMHSAGAISSEALRMGNAGFVGQGVDYLGQLVRTPGRALTAEHDFFRSIGYRMELNALATRQATQDVLAGRLGEEAMGSRIQELLDNPPPQLRMQAVNGTLYQTFTDAPGKLAQRIGELRNDYPLLKVIIPFYKIPSRIMAFTGERTPLAPFMQTFRDNIAAGGARQSMALAQVGIGTMTMLATADAVLSGQLTGSGPAEKGTRAILENEGWQPYSVRVGNRWVQYNRIEPVGSAMAMAADAVEAMQHFHAGVNGDDPDTANLALATTFAVANDITSKSYLQGLANFFETMSGDPSKASHGLMTEAGSLVPAGLAALDRMTDPNKREVYRMIDAIKARTPGFSEGQPPLRGPWGEPVANGSGMGASYDLFSPFGVRPAANEPIDAELLRQQIDIPRTPSRTAIHGVTLDLNRIDPKIYSRFQELAGNGYKGPDGLGLKDALNALVTGNHPYSPTYARLTDGPDGTKADMIRDIVSEYRNGAKEQLLREYAGTLGPMVDEGIAAKQFLKAGTP